jgi:hypothetical protein
MQCVGVTVARIGHDSVRFVVAQYATTELNERVG